MKTEYIEEEDNKVSLKSESKEDVKSLSLAPALESSVASSLAAIDATAAGGANLKQLVEEAVKKVLLESGAGAGVHNLMSSPRIKEEKHDSDDDVCIIEDNFKKEPDPEPAVDPTSSSTSGVSPPSLGRHKLYLPPDNCPQYKPTPLLQLQRSITLPLGYSTQPFQAPGYSTSTRDDLVATIEPETDHCYVVKENKTQECDNISSKVNLQTQADKSDDKIEAEEEQIRKLEEKRKLLEKYYIKKLQEKIVDDTKSVRDKESKSSRKKRKKKSSDDSESETESRKHKRKHSKHGKSPRKGSKHKKHHHRESEPSDDDDDLQDLGNFDIDSPAVEESRDNVADNQVLQEDNSNHEGLSDFQRTELEIKKLLGNTDETVKHVDKKDEDKKRKSSSKSFDELLSGADKIDKTKKHKSSHKTSGESSSRHKGSSSKDRSSSSKHKSSSSSKESSSRHKSSHRSGSKERSSKSFRSDGRERSGSSSKHKHREKERKSSSSSLPKKSDDKVDAVDDVGENIDLAEDVNLDNVDTGDNIEDGLMDMFGGMDEEDQLQQIFENYQPSLDDVDHAALGKLKQKEADDDDIAACLDKKRVAHEGAEMKKRTAVSARRPMTKMTPAQVMAERYKKLQQERSNATDPGEGSSSSSSRVAHSASSSQSPAVLSKAKQQLLAREKAREVMSRTPAVTNVKGSSRVAHTPTAPVRLRRPVATPDAHSKVPLNVRQTYLNTIIDECLKISGGDEAEAFTRAEKEERECSKKASSRMFYLNLVVNCIKKLRSEAAAAAVTAANNLKKPAAPVEKRSMLTTHLQTLAGKPGSVGSWSIEKTVTVSVKDIDEKLLYAVLQVNNSVSGCILILYPVYVEVCDD